MERSREKRYTDEDRHHSPPDRRSSKQSRDYEREKRDHHKDTRFKEPHRERRRDHSRSPRRDNDYDDRRRRTARDRNSRSPSDRRHSTNQESNRHNYRRNRNDNEESFRWGKKGDDNKADKTEEDKPLEKEKPNFGLSGALTEDTNKVNGVVVKYSEPPEARKPKRRWRLYPFKGEQALPVLHIHRQSCFLVGRDHKVVDLAVDHPSCSKQHAALQYRLVNFERDDGSTGKRVRLYLIDLDSANGTFLNNKKIDARKYYELFEKDVVKFGFSTREYVLLHENSREDQEDDDVDVKQEPKDEPADINP